MPSIARTTAAVLVLGVAVSACAGRHGDTAPPAHETAGTAAVGYGTIIAVRPIAARAQHAAIGSAGFVGFVNDTDPRATILGAIGGVLGAAAATPAVEFIIGEDGGRTVSVVQGNDLRLQRGERVVLSAGERTRLARGAPPAPSRP